MSGLFGQQPKIHKIQFSFDNEFKRQELLDK